MSKSYTFEEIMENRVKIRAIKKDVLYSEVIEICQSCGELMYIDALICQRSVIYASFVQREAANAAIKKINEIKNIMFASIALTADEYYPTNKSFVLDISESKLNEMEAERSIQSVRAYNFIWKFIFILIFFLLQI